MDEEYNQFIEGITDHEPTQSPEYFKTTRNVRGRRKFLSSL